MKHDALNCDTIITILKNNADGIFITDANNNIEFTNDAFLEMLGREQSEVIGKNPIKFTTSEYDQYVYDGILEHVQTFGSWKGELKITQKSKAVLCVEFSVSSTVDENYNIQNCMVLVRDITSQKEQEKLLQEMIYTDSLTGAYNRRYFDIMLHDQFERSKRTKQKFFLMYIDLDDFSQINNNFGHSCGDQILTKFVLKLKKIFRRTTDKIFRLGGDEFVIISTLDRDDGLYGLIESTLERMKPTLEQHFKINNTQMLVHASIGLVVVEHDFSQTTQEIVDIADSLMYEVKHNGKRGIKTKIL